MSEKGARDAEIIRLQSELLDHSGHVWPELSHSRANRLVTEINKLREANGFSRLDMAGRRRTPQ